MNTCNTNIPYLLTACHCYNDPEAGSVSQWRFIFHYWSPTCSPTQDGSTTLLFNGSLKNLVAVSMFPGQAMAQMQQG